jgi:hypothetical protein
MTSFFAPPLLLLLADVRPFRRSKLDDPPAAIGDEAAGLSDEASEILAEGEGSDILGNLDDEADDIGEAGGGEVALMMIAGQKRKEQFRNESIYF